MLETQTPIKPTTKRYFSKVPGSHYTFSDGHQIYFLHGRFDFDPNKYQEPFFSNQKDHPLNGQPKWKVYYDELEYLVKNNNPLIFEQGSQVTDQLPAELDPTKNAHSESAIIQSDAAMIATGKIREMGEANTGNGGTVSDVNSSTVDREIQKTIFAPRPTGPGASKVEEARANAAARQAAARQAAATAAVQNKNKIS